MNTSCVHRNIFCVNSDLTNQIRNDYYCSADPTIYNFSIEHIPEFNGLVDIYRETGYQSGQYAYIVSASANEDDIAPTTTYGLKIKSLTYAHYGLRMFWAFSGTYDVEGSKETPLPTAYANF